jgi:peptidoglycan/LPS O-acetylase OafA/YrhL
MPNTPRTGPGLLPWVQALRALAAFSVAFYHIANDAIAAGRDPAGLIGMAIRSMPWVAGVDIFFVISGFIIVHASANLFASPAGARRFLHRRLTRIVPLYWLLTTLFLATAVLQRSAVHGAIGSAAYILASYLFLPWPRPDGVIEPALGLGWTLDYEMFFYLVLAPFLLLPRAAAVPAAAAVLGALVAAGRIFGFTSPQLNFWSDPIILEFVLGMGLALAVAAGLTLPGWARLAMVGVGIAALHLCASGSTGWRVIAFGLPAALLVAAAVTPRQAKRPNLPTPSLPTPNPIMRALVRLGDASYAMYLFHPFIMRGFTQLSAHVATRSEASGILYIVLSLLAAQVCALAINAWVERKLTDLLRSRARSIPVEAV